MAVREWSKHFILELVGPGKIDLQQGRVGKMRQPLFQQLSRSQVVVERPLLSKNRGTKDVIVIGESRFGLPPRGRLLDLSESAVDPRQCAINSFGCLLLDGDRVFSVEVIRVPGD
jgi:hypothetical protein